jgi:carboxyl-terminal processing protease
LEQLILLAESKAAQEALEGLRNEDDRRDFINRLRGRLEQVRAARSVDRPGCQQHFRRAREINRQTVKLPEELVVYEMMRGALDPLDEFTTIIWPRETEEFDKHTRGNFIGVGIQIIKNRANEIEVVTPLDDTPAYRAGIRAGDVISHVDGVPLRDVTLNKVVEMITGERGTTVVLTVRRDGKEVNYHLDRTEVRIQSVKGVRRDPERDGRWNHWLDRENGIAFVRVTNFQKNTVEDVDAVLRDMSGLKGIILDLRGNPGGLLESAWQMASLFLKRGDGVVSTKGRIPDENHKYAAPTDGPFSDYPLVVLVDESSASASEIVSGAIRDNKRGVVVGARTFGKFSVQNLIPLSHSKAKLKITTASYYIPSGVSLHRKSTSETWGVEPNIPVRLVRWERSNLWQLRRDADLLGPAAAKAGLQPGEDESDAEEGPDSILEPAPAEDAGPVADVVGPPALPVLRQPDRNRRPKEDPQLDAALLVLRATLLGGSSSTLAAAERLAPEPTAKP